MRHAYEDYDADRGGVLAETHPNIAVEQRLPALGRREEDGDEHSPNGADDGVKKSGEG